MRRKRRAAARIAGHARRLGLLRAGHAVAMYAAARGELGTAELMKAAFASGCTVYLPRIVNWRSHQMEFLRHRSGVALHPVRHGLAEPLRGGPPVRARRLSVVFLPLVAVDARGTRLGMGAGFYDRYFAFRLGATAWRRPLLVGIGYDFQLVEHIDRAAWDVPVDAVITETGFKRCAGRNVAGRGRR